MTIFITISRGIIARNLLQNDFYRLVKQRFSKVVLITTAAGDARFVGEFAAPNAEIVPMPGEPDGFWDTVVSWLNRFLIFNESTVGRGLYWYVTIPSRAAWVVKFFRFTIIRIIFQPLSKLSIARRALQWLDYHFLQSVSVAQYEKLIETYSPNIVFVANILDEASLIKAARRRGIPTIAMPKTWDNPSKRYFRARADAIVAWSSFMKEEMTQLHDYQEDEVVVVGIPQFDYYIDSSRYESREDFCARVGLDPEKKIICLGSEGKIMPSDADIAGVVYDLIQQRKLSCECQLFIRPHFAHTNDAQKFDAFKGKPGVVIDAHNRPSEGFGDHWDYSKEQMDHFLSVLRHADVLINTASTLTLDAAAVGTPVILTAFDGYKKKPFYAAGARWYVCDYFRELMRYKPALEADSPESLRESINMLLQNPKLLLENQERLCERFCHTLDGKAGNRLYETLSRAIEK